MSDSVDHENRRIQLRLDVALMRELGIVRWMEIYLGPPPAEHMSPSTPEERAEREARKAERKHEILFASTSVRPKVERKERPFTAESVVTPKGHDNGQG